MKQNISPEKKAELQIDFAAKRILLTIGLAESILATLTIREKMSKTDLLIGNIPDLTKRIEKLNKNYNTVINFGQQVKSIIEQINDLAGQKGKERAIRLLIRKIEALAQKTVELANKAQEIHQNKLRPLEQAVNAGRKKSTYFK